MKLKISCDCGRSVTCDVPGPGSLFFLDLPIAPEHVHGMFQALLEGFAIRLVEPAPYRAAGCACGHCGRPVSAPVPVPAVHVVASPEARE